MNKLYDTDFVIRDKANDTLFRFESNGEIVIYGSEKEAQEDCYGNELVIKCTDLPTHHKEELIYQINN